MGFVHVVHGISPQQTLTHTPNVCCWPPNYFFRVSKIFGFPIGLLLETTLVQNRAGCLVNTKCSSGHAGMGGGLKITCLFF